MAVILETVSRHTGAAAFEVAGDAMLRKPWLVTAVQILILTLVLMLLRGASAFFVTDRSVLIGMETPTGIILLRYGLAIIGLLWLFMQLHWRRRLAWPSSLMLLASVGALSLSTPYTQMMFRVLVSGPDAYSPRDLPFPFGSQLQLETAAYLNVLLHAGLVAFFLAFASSRRVRDYLHWGER